jgi:hypothetical protein
MQKCVQRLGIFCVVLSSLALSGGGICAEPAEGKPMQIGEEVKFKDSTWVVISAREIGNRLASTYGVSEDLESPDGKYIYVKFKVTNETNEEEQILFTPCVRDSKGRRYEELEELSAYLAKGEKDMFEAALPAGLSKTFVAIFELPKNSEDVVFLTRSLDVLKTEKAVTLNLEAAKKLEADNAIKLKEQAAKYAEALKEENAKEMTERAEREKIANEQEVAKIDLRLAELKLIRDQDLARINQITNFKRTPVREGTREHQLCLESSRRIEMAENEARSLIEKKKALKPSK